MTSPPLAVTAAAAACSLLFACDAGDNATDAGRLTGTAVSTETVRVASGYGLNLPKTLDGFTRVDTEDRGHGSDIVAGYARLVDPAPIYATIRLRHVATEGLRPLFSSNGSDTTLGDSAPDLDRSIRQIGRFYPRAKIIERRDIFLLRFGVIQPGRSATLEFEDILDGRKQPIRLEIYDFCCERNAWSYEYRFRYPSDLPAHTSIYPFVKDLPWSPEPSGSVDAAEAP